MLKMIDDHEAFKKEYKITNELEKLVLDITSDLDLSDIQGVKLNNSDIHGLGVFAEDFKKGKIIGYARLDGNRTILGRYTNHAKSHNAKPLKNGNNIMLYAIKDIYQEEITVDYRDMIDINNELKVIL
jgi:hypothetical protein